MSERPTVAILGAGRAGCSFHHALSENGYRVVALWTRSESTAAAARAEGFPVRTGPMPAELRAAQVVLLAVSDGAVGPLARELAAAHQLRSDALVVHLAGALDLGPLDPILGEARASGSLHVLASLASRRSALAGVSAAVDASNPQAAAVLEQIAAALDLQVVKPHGERALYHAAACVAGNFPQVLMEAAVQLLGHCGLAPDEARRALGPLLLSAARNAISPGGVAGLTGPISRGDADTVRRHLHAMTALQDEALLTQLYRAAGEIAADMVADRSAEAADAVRRALA